MIRGQNPFCSEACQRFLGPPSLGYPTSALSVIRQRAARKRSWQSVAVQQREYSALGRERRSRLTSDTGQGKQHVHKDQLLQARAIRQDSKSVYERPTTGILSYLPHSWVPYAELARLEKPAGTMYLFFPCLFSTILAASMTSPLTSPSEIVATSGLFLTGAFVMRGAGCTVNDLWDRNLDPHVKRTKFRPLARRAITPYQATAFLGAQLLTGLGILFQFPASCLYYGIPSLLLVGLYPLAKRVTNYPQFVLGLTFSWGAIMGFPAMGIDLLMDDNALYAAAALYGSCVAWTVHYDMIYAYMDIKDDAKAGIKSIALRHENDPKSVLYLLSVGQVALLGLSYYFAGVVDPNKLLLLTTLPALQLWVVSHSVNLSSVRSCQTWFNWSPWVVGGMIAVCLYFNYQTKAAKQQSANQIPTSALKVDDTHSHATASAES